MAGLELLKGLLRPTWQRPSATALQQEYDVEYLKHFRDLYGDIFPTSEDFIKAVEGSPETTITPGLDALIGNRSRTGSFESLLDLIKSYRSYPKYRNEETLTALQDRIRTGQPVDLPIIAQDPAGAMRVLSGNTRLDLAFQNFPEAAALMLPVDARLYSAGGGLNELSSLLGEASKRIASGQPPVDEGLTVNEDLTVDENPIVIRENWPEILANYLLTESWPSRAMQDAFAGALAPGDVYAGRLDSNSPEALERILGLTDLTSPAALLRRPVRGVAAAGPILTDEDMAKIMAQIEKALGPKDYPEPIVPPSIPLAGTLDEIAFHTGNPDLDAMISHYADSVVTGKMSLQDASNKLMVDLKDNPVTADVLSDYLGESGSVSGLLDDVIETQKIQMDKMTGLEALLGDTREAMDWWKAFGPLDLAEREARRIAGGYLVPAVRGSNNPLTRIMRSHYESAGTPEFYFYPQEQAAHAGGYGGNYYPVWLRMQNPADIDYPRAVKALMPAWSRTSPEPKTLDELFALMDQTFDVPESTAWSGYEFNLINRLAKEAGRDSAIFRGVRDVGDPMGSGSTPQTQFVTYDPAQAKSRLAARVFDPTDPDITWGLAGGVPMMPFGGLDAGRNGPTEIDRQPLIDFINSQQKQIDPEFLKALLEGRGA